MKKLIDAYEKLYQTTNLESGYKLNKEFVDFSKLSHFVGMKGCKYDVQKIRLLIVGRAVNGWKSIDAKTSEEFSKKALELFEGNKFDWIVYDNGVLRNDELSDGKYYWLNRSSFWRTNRKAWLNLCNKEEFKDNENDRWIDYVAWTNLYKIAPSHSGNPTAAMSKAQLDACKDILKAEIEILKPTHILFVTGYEGWFDDFRDIFDAEFTNIKKNEYRSDKKNSYFVEANATTEDGIKIIVACRPEGRDESRYIEDVKQHF